MLEFIGELLVIAVRHLIVSPSGYLANTVQICWVHQFLRFGETITGV